MRRLITRVVLVGLLGITFVAPVAALAATRVPAKESTTTILRGTFTDSAKYTGSGSLAVVRRKSVRTIRVARNFRADPGAIRLRTYLATSPSGRTFIDLGSLRESGAQSFRVPAGVSLSRYRYVIAWCAAVDEPITQALLVQTPR